MTSNIYILFYFILNETRLNVGIFIRKTCTTVPDKLLLVARKKDIRLRQLLAKNPNEIDMVSFDVPMPT